MARLEYQIVGDSTKLTAAIKQSVSGFTTLENSANKTTAAVNKEISSLGALQKTLLQLNRDKLNIIDEGRLAKQNKLIQELEAEITRFKNVGKVGFDATGVAIEKADTGMLKFGSTLGKAISPLRTIAYILPGLGIAGIFNLAFEAIGAAASALDLFDKKATVAQGNLANLNAVNQEAAKQYGEQSTNLRVLYSAATDVANAENNRLLAAKELQKEFPSLFGNIKTETILNGGAAAAYDLASKAILENAKAKAAAGKISELAAKQLEAEFNILKIQQAKRNQQANLDKQTADYSKKFVDNLVSQGYSIEEAQKLVSQSLKGGSDKINREADNAIAVQEKSKKALQNQIDFLVQFAGGNNTIAQALSAGQNTKTGSGGESSPFAALNNQLDDILRKTQSLSAQAGLSGYALEVQKVKDKYIELNATLDENIKKTAESKNLTSGEKSQLEIKQVADRIALAKAERAELDAEFDKAVLKALESTDKIIDKRKEAAEKNVKLEQDAFDKIAEINNTAVANIGSKQETETEKIKLEWEKRKKAAQDYYNELLRLNGASTDKSDPLGFKNAINSLKLQGGKVASGMLADNAATSQIANKALEPLTQGLSRSVRQFGQDFFETLTNVDTYAKSTFTSIFADLTSKLTTSLNRVFQDVILNGLAKSLSQAISSGTGGLVNKDGNITGKGLAIAGAGIAGGIISASTPKTSTIGQAAGGALSGAATGAAIGSVVPVIGTALGAVAGGIIGAIGGIFGSSSARKKQEELQKQQLEEAKKQTEYLRQQQVAYTSQIIGRMTANGTITGVSVGSQGQLVATVSGKDLQFVLDRNKNGR